MDEIHRSMRRAAPAPCHAASFALALASLALPRFAADPVTGWTSLAGRIGTEAANRHTPAVMHRAMHDAGDAAAPLYGRQEPPASDEPPDSGAEPPPR